MNQTKKRNILATSALPYANGDIHLGHLVEYIQTDVWARFQRLRGHQCLYICGSDAHGTPIMLSAKKAGITPQTLIAQQHQAQADDFAAFDIAFDYFHTTDSIENKTLCETIYATLQANGDIEKRAIKQAYDEKEKMFLPDRFVKGTCPKCQAPDQYGDNCDHCGATYTPLEMINPVSSISGTTPVEKASEHYFFRLEKYEKVLQDWLNETPLQSQVKHKLQEWFVSGLKDWDISRDKPYFGFTIPGETEKYFYVWLDAPIGYIASLTALSKRRPDICVDDFFAKDAANKTELYHFIGKDIMYFHALFWPALLYGSGHRLPTNIFAHGFLTINGEKMSKSRGTFIKAKDYLQHLDPQCLRYYFCAKLGDNVTDIDLNLADFRQRVNSDLVGKVVNIASRCAGFIHKKAGGVLATQLPCLALYEEFAQASQAISASFEGREFAQATKHIMQLADKANRYIDDQKPWVLAKQPDTDEQVQAICTQGLNLFRVLMIYLKPILPSMAKNVEAFLQIPALQWDDCHTPLLSHTIAPFKPLMQRIADEQIDALAGQS